MRFRLLPAFLIALGLALLLGNLGIVPKEDIRIFFHTWWPLLLVGLGAAMLLLPRGRCGHHRRCGRSERREEILPPEAAGSR